MLNSTASLIFPAPVPVLRCDLGDVQSRLAVARMILQRAKMGSRGCIGADDGMDAAFAGKNGDGSSNSFGRTGVRNFGSDGDEDVDGNFQNRGGISPLFFSSIL